MIITQKVGDTNTTFRKLQYHWQQTTHAISLKSKIMNIYWRRSISLFNFSGMRFYGIDLVVLDFARSTNKRQVLEFVSTS